MANQSDPRRPGWQLDDDPSPPSLADHDLWGRGSVRGLAEVDWNEFEAYVGRIMAHEHIAGAAVGVARDGRVIYARGFGVKDVVTGDPVTPETIFGIASVSKSFTAMAVMQLADEGRLSVGGPAQAGGAQSAGLWVKIGDDLFPARASGPDRLVFDERGETVIRFFFNEQGVPWAAFHHLRMMRRVPGGKD